MSSLLVRLVPLLGLVAACTDAGDAVPPTDAGPIDPSPDERVVDHVEVFAPTTELEPGATMQLAYAAYDANDEFIPNAPVSWRSADLGVMFVSPTGEVSAVTVGQTRISAYSRGVTGWVDLSVRAPTVRAERVVITSPEWSALDEGSSASLTATAYDGDGNALIGHPILWTSANPHIATITFTGKIAALRSGESVITAHSDGHTNAYLLKVIDRVDQVGFVGGASISMFAQSTRQMTAIAYNADGEVLDGRAVTWSGGNAAIAVVSPSGVITALGNGSTTVRATVGGVTSILAIDVRTLARMQLSESELTVAVGAQATLRALAYDSEDKPVLEQPVWASSDPAIASVSATGVVTALAAGTVTISATLGATTVTAQVHATQMTERLLTRVNGGALPGTLYAYDAVRMDVDQGVLITGSYGATYQLIIMGPRYENGVRVGYRHHNSAGLMIWDEASQTYFFQPDAIPAGPSFTGRKVAGGIEISYQPDPRGAPATLMFATN